MSVDDCSLSADKCSPTDECLNTDGSSDPPEGITGPLGAESAICLCLCVDVDECAVSADDCSPADDCVNTQGSFDCLPRCADGFQRSTLEPLHCIGA